MAAAYVVMQCLSVHMSVTFVDHFKTNKHIIACNCGCLLATVQKTVTAIISIKLSK